MPFRLGVFISLASWFAAVYKDFFKSRHLVSSVPRPLQGVKNARALERGHVSLQGWERDLEAIWDIRQDSDARANALCNFAFDEVVLHWQAIKRVADELHKGIILSETDVLNAIGSGVVRPLFKAA